MRDLNPILNLWQDLKIVFTDTLVNLIKLKELCREEHLKKRSLSCSKPVGEILVVCDKI